MGRYHRYGVESTAALAGHPLHHMLVPFPIAFLIGALGTDIAFLSTANPFWAQASFWLIIAGVVMALAAAIPGLIDFLTINRVRNIWVSWTHLIGNLVIVALALVNIGVRLDDPAAGVQNWGLWLSAITTALLLFSGWLGGELAYRYGIGAIRDYSPKVQEFHVEVERDRTETPAQRTSSRGW